MARVNAGSVSANLICSALAVGTASRNALRSVSATDPAIVRGTDSAVRAVHVAVAPGNAFFGEKVPGASATRRAISVGAAAEPAAGFISAVAIRATLTGHRSEKRDEQDCSRHTRHPFQAHHSRASKLHAIGGEGRSSPIFRESSGNPSTGHAAKLASFFVGSLLNVAGRRFTTAQRRTNPQNSDGV